ncbi:MAG: D-aminoacyl-tRNA deacylase [Acidobacteriota bacterium]
MRLVLQRVSQGAVRVEGEVVGAVGMGLVVLVGVEVGDDESIAAAAAAKLASLRIFEDPQGRMNLDAASAGAGFLVVSQFTLAGQPLAKGRRPSFSGAEKPARAEPLVDYLVACLRREGFAVETGQFGAKMEVSLSNDGPVTFVLDL